MNDDTTKAPGNEPVNKSKTRKTRKVGVDEMLAAMKKQKTATAHLADMQERLAQAKLDLKNAEDELQKLFTRTASSTIKKALIEMTQRKLA